MYTGKIWVWQPDPASRDERRTRSADDRLLSLHASPALEVLNSFKANSKFN